MSRIGKQIIPLLDGVSITVENLYAKVKGPKGEIQVLLHPSISLEISEKSLTVLVKKETENGSALHGLTRNLIANAVVGVKDGFVKKLEILGVGFKANVAGNKLNLSLGFSHPVEYIPMEGIKLSMDPEAKNVILVEGIDRQKVGEEAARIRKLKTPEPYKGKGIRYLGEKVRKKAGKTASK